LLGLAVCGLATPAQAADVPGNSSTRVILKTGTDLRDAVFERRGDSDWYRVTLKGGQNYAFAVSSFATDDGCAKITLRTLKGTAVDSASANGGNDGGFEFRPASGRTYFVAFADCVGAADAWVDYPNLYSGSIRADARADTTTKATLQVGQVVNGINNWGYDVDYYRATLSSDKTYTISFDRGPESYLSLISAGGRVIVNYASGSVEGVKVPASGTYYVVVYGSDDGGGRYTLGLTTP
jgi:hypothetical protein